MSEPKRYRLSKEAREAGEGLGAIVAFMIEEDTNDTVVFNDGLEWVALAKEDVRH